MQRAGALKFWKKIGWIGLGLSLTAFSAPQKGDLLELTAFLNGRSHGRFRTIDQNKILILQKGTRGVVKEIKHFKGTGNYGLCIEILNATDFRSSDKCVWAYYNVKNPAMNIYSGSADSAAKKQVLDAWAKDPQKVTLNKASSPAKAQAVETTKDVPGIPEKRIPFKAQTATAARIDSEKAAHEGADTMQPKEDTKEIARSNIKTIENLNKSIGSAMTKQEVPQSPSCPDGNCNKPVISGNDCSSRNAYLESSLANLLAPSAPHASFFNSPQKEIINKRCIKANMTLFGAGKRYQCNANGAAKRVSSKACVSDNKLNLISKSFNLAADCFGIANGDSEAVKQQSALAIFSLMAQESGMHMNVVSPSGAAGVGQLTDNAIKAVNLNLRTFHSRINSIKKNPNCSQVLASAFEKPMSTARLCDRIGTNKDNPLKNIAYSFAYQNMVRKSLDRARFSNKTFDKIISPGLNPAEAARLKFSLAAWGHNTGPGGLLHPLGYLMRDYVRKGRMVRTAADVDKFLHQLKLRMKTNPHPGNSRRRNETSNYHKNILAKVSAITKEPKSCLAN